MPDHLLLPFTLDRAINSAGEAYEQAVRVCDAGTDNEKNVYTNASLATAADNPVLSDSGGWQAARYIGTGSYKIQIYNTNGSDDEGDWTLLKTEDNLPGALDTSPFSAATAPPEFPVLLKATNFTILEANRGAIINSDPTGGTLTHTLPSAVTVGDDWSVTVKHTGTANSVIIETVSAQTIDGALSFTLSYQYEAVTLVSDGANWTIKSDGFLRRPSGVVLPQGYLTPTSGTPVITGDVSAATSIYYTPFVGNLCPIYDGTRFVPREFTEQTITLVSQHTASNIFDFFSFMDGSTFRVGTGPAWTDSSSGAGDRTASALTRISGILVNNAQVTARNGTSTYTVDANKGTYLGSMLMDGTNGQVSFHRTWGQNRKWGLWNMYNRRPILLKAGDSTSSWSYNSTFRAANNSTSNKLTVFCGVAEEMTEVKFKQNVTITNINNGTNASARIGIGWNSTSSSSGTYSMGGGGIGSGSQSLSELFLTLDALHINPPMLGIVDVTALESAPNTAGGTKSFQGGEEDMCLMARWMG
jgi:hypothetical protein